MRQTFYILKKHQNIFFLHYGRRWAATYIFHLGQIQPPRVGEGWGNTRDHGASEPNDTIHEVQDEMRYLAMYSACYH